MSESHPNQPFPPKPPIPQSAHRVMPTQPQQGTAKVAGIAIQTHKPTEEELEPIGLVDDTAEAAGAASKRIQAFGVQGMAQHRNWKRQANKTGTGSVRVRSFHGRLSDQGLSYIDDAINDWLDQHPDIEIKFVTSTVGVFEGKIREPALILNVWY